MLGVAGLWRVCEGSVTGGSVASVAGMWRVCGECGRCVWRECGKCVRCVWRECGECGECMAYVATVWRMCDG